MTALARAAPRRGDGMTTVHNSNSRKCPGVNRASKATRCGTDWEAIVEAHSAVLAMLGLIESRRS
jgi:hypothetical protein